MKDIEGDMSSSDTRLNVVDVRKVYPATSRRDIPAVDGVSFRVKNHEFFTLLGPSGCGKSTILRAVAGLESISGGSIEIDGTVVNSFTDRVEVPAHRRGLGMVFQNYAIWPHMNVWQNVEYPLRRIRPRLSSKEISARIEEALAATQLSDFSSRDATAMSGGQQQRLALARALVARPRLLLLDEPLSNLDARLRETMLAELARIQSSYGITTLYVTHDQREALSMSTTIAVLQNGKILQRGTPQEIYARPATKFVAEFVGNINRLDGSVVQNSGSAEGITVLINGVGELRASSAASDVLEPGNPVDVGIRFEGVRISAGERATEGNLSNAVKGRVRQILFFGDSYRIVVELVDGTEIFADMHTHAAGNWGIGDDVEVYFPPDQLLVYPQKGADSLQSLTGAQR